MADQLDKLIQRGIVSADSKSAQDLMTHNVDQPNPAKPYIEGIKRFASGGLQQALGLPENAVSRALQNEDNISALGALRLMPFGKAVTLSSKQVTQHAFHILNQDDDKVGSVFAHYKPRSKDLVVDNIFGSSPLTEAANTLGTSEIRSLLPEVKRHFPDAETVSGLRVSGARESSGSQGAITIPLK